MVVLLLLLLLLPPLWKSSGGSEGTEKTQSKMACWFVCIRRINIILVFHWYLFHWYTDGRAGYLN